MKVSVRQIAVCSDAEYSDELVVLDTRGRLWFASIGSGPRNWAQIELPDEPEPGVVEDSVDRLVGMMRDGDTLRIVRPIQSHRIAVEFETLCLGVPLNFKQVADVRDVRPSELFRLAASMISDTHGTASRAEAKASQ